MPAAVLLLALSLIYFVVESQYKKTCNPMGYGAKGDGKSDDTSSIQRAFNDCYLNNANGLVSFPSGKSFLSFALNATKVNNIGFEIQAGAYLVINNDRRKWPGSQDFLTFTHVDGLRMFGKGEVNGQGQVWWEDTTAFRPTTVKAEGCRNLVIKDLTFKDPPTHCLELYADAAELDHVTVLAPYTAGNTDAVDVHGSPFWIHDCYFSNGDDNVACHANDTLVENCYFGEGHGGSIGSLANGWHKNITFNNITFNGTHNGIRIKTNPGAGPGRLWDISYTNLNMKNVENPIVITQFYNGTEEKKSYLVIDGVLIENVTATGGGNAGQFLCQDSTPCHHIELNHVHISAYKNGGDFTCQQAYGSASDTKPNSCLKAQ